MVNWMSQAPKLQTSLPSVESSLETRDLWYELMNFYAREAWLLDQRRYHEWLDLMADDLFYFMPRRLNVARHDLDRELTEPGDNPFLEESKKDMETRVLRLDTGMAWAEDPPSRTRHLITNLMVEPESNGEVRAMTAFLVYKSHLETDHDIYTGYREDILRRAGTSWQIARRLIVLDTNVLLSKNLSIFF